ncbi:signaling lymphocytic activation molecule isoform X2 [Xenopus tropicalis]|uniref:Signaling lymphocytic activation molecule isoform X2 n=1 Tax=Xenopus tropicalis TaxID=8364 RepID=A0A8J1ITE8_XENTR|nr:signaling lymphocytic activation molecule isoform X2 [Xenopus tropicalis]
MKLLLYQSLMLLSWYQYISCNGECGPRINVPGAEGGGATLPVRVQEQIKDISWVISDGGRVNHFATTKPNEPIDIRDNKFDGRLRSETNGSLTLTDLTNQDQRIYTANIRSQSNQRCDQLYHLQVFKKLSSEDILIHQNITQNDTHNGPCTFTGTLTCTVNASDVTLTWNNTNSPGTEVTNHTLRVYNAQSLAIYSCAARNPISEASRTAHNKETCDKGHTALKLAGNSAPSGWIVLGLIPVGIVVAAGYCWFKRKKDQHNLEIKENTVYGQVQRPEKGTVSDYGTEKERDEERALTVYTEVLLPKGGRAGQGNPTQGEKIETVYSEVTLPAQGPEDQCRKKKPYSEDQKEESCYDLVKAPINTRDPSSNNPSRPSYNQLV